MGIGQADSEWRQTHLLHWTNNRWPLRSPFHFWSADPLTHADPPTHWHLTRRPIDSGPCRLTDLWPADPLSAHPRRRNWSCYTAGFGRSRPAVEWRQRWRQKFDVSSAHTPEGPITSRALRQIKAYVIQNEINKNMSCCGSAVYVSGAPVPLLQQ